MTAKIVECRFCGKSHGVRCPEIKAIEYHENGAIKRIEYLTPSDYYAPMTSPYRHDSNGYSWNPPWGPATTRAM